MSMKQTDFKMKTEYESKILNINVEDIKDRLEKLGAKKYLERSMRRYVYDINPENKKSWIRLRDDDEKITLTIKEISSYEIDGTKEIEIIVSDFEKTNELLKKLGFMPKAYQENKRISYRLDGVEIEIDFWPKIPPYLEVEGKSIEDVKKTIKLLGFEFSEATSLSTKEVYKKYGLKIHDFKELKF